MRTQFSKFFAVLTFMVIGLFIACGGGGGGSNPAPPPAPSTYSISGTVGGAVSAGVTVSLPGYTSATTGANGTFTFTAVSNGTYTVTPSLSGYTFTPAFASVVVSGANVTGVNFIATATQPTLHTVSGVVTKAGSVGILSGVSVKLTLGTSPTPDTIGSTVLTDASGNFVFANVANGTYTATPSLSGYTFTPASTSVVVNGANVVNVNFTATANPSNAYSLYWIRISDNAVFDDEFATKAITFEASISGTGFTPYIEGGSPAIFDKTQPYVGVKAVMQDTGALDASNPGAHIYRVTVVPGSTPHLRYYGNTVDSSTFGVAAYDNTGKFLTSLNPIISGVGLGIVSRSQTVATTQVSSDVFAAPNMVNVVLPDFNTNTAMKKVYQYYPDVFDTAVFQQIGRTTGANIAGGTSIKNTVLGINVPLRDTSADFGSNGVLSNVVEETPSDTIDTGLLHEFGHSNAFYLNLPALNLTYTGGVHAAPIGTIGQMGGDYLLVQQSNGDYLVTMPDSFDYRSRKYSDIELYLLGFIPASVVQPMRFITDPIAVYNPGDIVPSAKTMLVTIDDIIRVYGARSPSSATSPKSHQALFVGVSERPMTPAEIALVNRIAFYYGSNAAGGEIDTQGLFPVRSMPSFYAATNGNGTMVTAVPPKK